MREYDATSNIDMITVSIDSFEESTNEAIGRGRGSHVTHVRRVIDLCRAFDVGVKLNTVVCDLNAEENMAPHINEIDPFRWKVVQMYLVDGMNKNTNDESTDASDLAVTSERFEAFVKRHEDSLRRPSVLQAEPNERFVGAYLLLNEKLKFMSTGRGAVESDSILEVGVAEAIAQSDYTSDQFERRNGEYFQPMASQSKPFGPLREAL